MGLDGLNRRETITLLAGAAAWPVVARAQGQGRLPTIGFLGPNASNWTPWTAAFVARLRELGWIEHRTVAIDYRWSEGAPDRDSEIAAEFVRRKVDVIVAYGAAVPTLKQATSAIPIVFPVALDPVGMGLVTSFMRPGGNVTGLSRQSTDLAAKRLSLLRELVPRARRLAVMGAPMRASKLEIDEVERAARKSGIEVAHLEFRRAEDLAPSFEALKDKVDALYVVTNGLVGTYRKLIATSALDVRLPTMFSTRDVVHAGGLMSYGPNFEHLFRRAADFVDKILRGTNPADIPVEQPTKFDLAINLSTAKLLGISVSRIMYVQATELIE